METQPKYIPTTGKLKELGLAYQIQDTSENGAAYKGAINSSNPFNATHMVCKWLENDIWQVAHKERGESSNKWKFKGFGNFTDEAHFLRLLAMPPVIMEDALGDYLNNT